MNFLGKIKKFFSFTNLSNYSRLWLSGQSTAIDDLSKETAIKFATVFSCVRVRAETFISAPLVEYKKNPNGTREPSDDTELADLFKYVICEVNGDQYGALPAFEAASYDIDLMGNAYFQKLKNTFGDIVGLYYIPAPSVLPYRNKDTGRINYKIGSNVYTRDDIFHVPGPSFDGIVGLTPIEVMSNTLTTTKYYETYSNNFFKNGISPSAVIELPGHLENEAMKRFAANLKDNYTGMLTGTPLILEDGAKYTPHSMKFTDAQFIEGAKLNDQKICGIYRVPPHLIQNLERSTNNNIEHQSLEFVQYTMLPVYKRFEFAVNTQLLTKEQREKGYFFEFNIDGLLRGDSKSRAEAYQIYRYMGVYSVNDIRKKQNEMPIPNGDIYLQPVNMVEAGKEQNNESNTDADNV